MPQYASRLAFCVMCATSGVMDAILCYYITSMSAPVAALLGSAATAALFIPLMLRWQWISLVKVESVARSIAATSTQYHAHEIERLSMENGKLALQLEDALAKLAKAKVLQRDAKGRIIAISAVPSTSTPVVIHDHD